MHNAGNRKVNMKLKIYEAGEQLNRIANTLEEILRLVKLDLRRWLNASRNLKQMSCRRNGSMIEDLKKRVAELAAQNTQCRITWPTCVLRLMKTVQQNIEPGILDPRWMMPTTT
jgi:hypothetical protein